MNEKANSEWESPNGLDLNPRPPQAVRVSKLAAGVLLGFGVVILLLFAYGGYKRQQRQVAALSEGEIRKSVAPATAAGVEISKVIPNGNLPSVPAALESGILQPPPETQKPVPALNGQDRVIVRQPPPVQQATQPPSVREPTPQERRIMAAYEREQAAIASPTTSRFSQPTASRGTANQQPSQLAQLLNATSRPAITNNQMNPELLRALIGKNAGASQDYEDQKQQRAKEEFLSKARSTQTSDYLKSTRTPALSPYEIKAGWEIPAVMEQALNSDLPGEVKGLVTSNVYDTATGQHVLIPQGSRLIGLYSSQIGYGQDGVQVIWHRVIFPDASSLDLGGMSGQDTHGQSGFRSQVDHHHKRLIGFAVLTSLFSAAADLATSRNRTLLSYPSRTEVFGSSASREATELGAQITRRNLNVQPTIKIPVGYKFNVRVNRDILFDSPYSVP